MTKTPNRLEYRRYQTLIAPNKDLVLLSHEITDFDQLDLKVSFAGDQSQWSLRLAKIDGQHRYRAENTTGEILVTRMQDGTLKVKNLSNFQLELSLSFCGWEDSARHCETPPDVTPLSLKKIILFVATGVGIALAASQIGEWGGVRGCEHVTTSSPEHEVPASSQRD